MNQQTENKAFQAVIRILEDLGKAVEEGRITEKKALEYAERLGLMLGMLLSR